MEQLRNEHIRIIECIMFFRCHCKVNVVHPGLVGLFYMVCVNTIYNSSNSRGSKFISGIPKESLLKIGLNSAVKTVQ